ncbi:6395_t:CDS:2 [Entrophospora sp. SA101]|nr:6395_t:CDS:2 [Entrophospora sp. SA101]
MSSGNNYGLLNSDDNDNDNDVTYHYESSSDDTDDTSNKMKKRKYRYEYFVGPVAYAENDTIDGVSEILFLNYILAGTNKHDGIQQYVEFLKHYLSPGVLNLCHNLDRICRKSYLECRQLIKKWNKDNDNPTDDENLVIEAYDEWRQPGFSVYSLFKNTKRHLLVIEIKSKNEDCNSDLVKLANEMKDIIDKCIDDNINDEELVILVFI